MKEISPVTNRNMVFSSLLATTSIILGILGLSITALLWCILTQESGDGVIYIQLLIRVLNIVRTFEKIVKSTGFILGLVAIFMKNSNKVLCSIAIGLNIISIILTLLLFGL